MRIVLRYLPGLPALFLGATIAVAAPQNVDDPDKYAGDVMRLLSSNDIVGVAKMISDTTGQPAYEDTVQKALSVMSGKGIDYSDKVIDNTFGKSLRQIVYYCFIDKFGFVYFRFNFKMTSHGWVLAYFNFKTETNELFPKDFIDR